MKVQNEMSTRISVDAVSAVGSLSAFRNAIRGASDAWRAQEAALRNSGNFAGAAQERMRGLNQVIDLQKAKLKELQDRQEGLDLSNQKQASQFLKLERQIQQANKQLASYEAQADRARNSVRSQVSGLAALQHSYEQSRQASAAYVTRLQAEGRTASATVERYRQLRSSLTNLQDQYRKQEFLLRQVANDTGKNSDAYIKQREQLDKTATSIAKTKDEMQSMQSSINRLQPTGIQRIDDAVVKTRDNASRMTSRLSSGFDNLKNHMMGIAVTATTVGAAVVSSVNKAADVQKVMVENQNLMRTAGERAATTQKEVNQMYADGERYSVQYGESQKTIAQGYQELIKRGYDGQQALGAMKSILEASKASGDSFDDTMKVTTSTLEAFGMRAESTGGMMRNTAKAADTLAKAADVTSTSFNSIGVGMEYAGSSAKQSGVSMRETAAILGVLSNNGLEASQAGTSLQRIFTRLAAPTSTATNEMKKYNLSIDDFKDKSGHLESVNTIFKKINANVPKAERLQFFNQVFGQTAQNAAGILSRTAALSDKNSQSLAHVENQLKTAYSEDYVGKLARRNMNSAKNSQDRFKYASQAIQIEIGRNMLPALSKASQSMANAFGRKDTQRGLRVIARGLGTVANALASLVSFIGKHTTTVKVFGTVMLTAFAGVKLLNGIGRLRAMMPLLSSGIRLVGTAAKIATLGFNPWAIGIELVVTAFTLLYKNVKPFRTFVNDLGRQTKQLAKHFVDMGRNILNNAGKLHNSLTRGWNNYWRSVQRGWNNYWRQQNRQQQQNQRTQERQEQASRRRRQRALANFNRTVSRDARGAWKDLENAAKNGSSRVGNWYDRMRDNTSRTVQNMAREHPRIFGDMYKTVEDRTKVWHDLVNGHWNRLGSDTANYTSDMRKTNHDIFADMYDKLNSLTGGRLGDMKNAWDKALNAIHDSVVNIGGHIHQAFDNLMNGLIDVFKGLINGIVDGINWVVDHVGGSGHLSKFSIGHFANGTNGPIMKKQLAILNDAPDNEYRELVHKKATGKTFLMPAKRNILMPLEPGDEVLDGKRTNQLMKSLGVTAHYANGAIGGFFSNVFDTAKDAADDAMDWVDKALKNVIEFGKELFEHFTNAVKPKSNDSLNSALKINLPGYFGRALQSWLKKQLDQMNTDNPSGTGVERWRPVIMRAFAALHVAPASWKVEKLLRQIQTESGGDPNAWQQVHDVNSGGNEARGLLQFAGSTWAADALPGHTDWHKGYNEILAAIHVLENGGEGGWGNVGNGHGWASGGLITQHGMYEVGEYNRPEMIIPLDISKRGRAYTLLAQVMSQFKSEDASNNTVDTEDSQVKSLNQKFDALLAQNQQLISLIDKLIGVTDSATNPAARYKRTQRDINMARAQSFI